MDRYDTIYTGFGLDTAFESAILKVDIGKLDYRTVDRTALAEEKPTGHSLVHFGPGLALEHPAALERL